MIWALPSLHGDWRPRVTLVLKHFSFVLPCSHCMTFIVHSSKKIGLIGEKDGLIGEKDGLIGEKDGCSAENCRFSDC